MTNQDELTINLLKKHIAMIDIMKDSATTPEDVQALINANQEALELYNVVTGFEAVAH